jgi:hypothetical protein
VTTRGVERSLGIRGGALDEASNPRAARAAIPARNAIWIAAKKLMEGVLMAVSCESTVRFTD